MKYLLLCSTLLCLSVTFSQSKKKQIQDLNRKIDSLELIVSSSSMLLDSCAQNVTVQAEILKKKEQENSMLRRIMKGYIKTIDELNSRLIESEINSSTNSSERISQIEKKEIKQEIVVKDEDIPLIFRNGSGSDKEDFERRKVARNYDTYSGIDRRTRIRLNDVNVNDIEFNESATIYYKLTIDHNGNVIAFIINKVKSSAENEELMNEVGRAIQKQVKYNKVTNTKLAYLYYVVHLKAN